MTIVLLSVHHGMDFRSDMLQHYCATWLITHNFLCNRLHFFVLGSSKGLTDSGSYVQVSSIHGLIVMGTRTVWLKLGGCYALYRGGS